MLAWIDDSNGDLLFSWANLDQANKSSEWQEASVVPSPSQINDPRILWLMHRAVLPLFMQYR